MARYPVKMLKDEQNQPFVPMVSAESIYTNDDMSFEEKFNTKLEASDLKEGTGIILEQEGNSTTISVDFGATDNIIDNLDTTVAGQGPLDARQGNVLKNMIPAIVDNLESSDATKTLSANQGRVLKDMSVPTGGATGQVLKKSSDNDHELEWGDAADPNAIVGDGSIMKIIELTYAEYKTLESNGELKEDTEYHITDVENGTATYMTEAQIETMIDTAKKAIYPVGSVIYNSNNINPQTYLGYGTWQLTRTFYGGELLGYGVVYGTDVGTKQTAGVAYAFSDISLSKKEYYIQNNLNGVLTGSGGAIYIQTKGIVGMVEAFMSVSGYGGTGIKGFWWRNDNYNELPTGVNIWSSGKRGMLLTGPYESNYGGNSNMFLYQVTTNEDVGFYINPLYQPYGGEFTPCAGGVGCQLMVKAYAKGGTNYMWTRTA